MQAWTVWVDTNIPVPSKDWFAFLAPLSPENYKMSFPDSDQDGYIQAKEDDVKRRADFVFVQELP